MGGLPADLLLQFGSKNLTDADYKGAKNAISLGNNGVKVVNHLSGKTSDASWLNITTDFIDFFASFTEYIKSIEKLNNPALVHRTLTNNRLDELLPFAQNTFAE